MDLETVTQNETIRERKISYNIDYMWSLEKWHI